MDRIKLIGCNLSLGSYSSFINSIIKQATSGEQFFYVCVANVHTMIEAHQSSSFEAIVNNADMVTPDGIPLTWALKFLYGIKQERVAGMDLLPDLLIAVEKEEIPIAFYGGTEEMLKIAKVYLGKTYPNIIVANMYSPPFRPLTADEEIEVIRILNDSGAKIIFVVLGCPKQEKWMASMKGKINAVLIGIGGALPVLVGMQKRAPIWMQKKGLEWFYRLSQEPGRLFMRYLVTNFLFIYLILKKKFF
ncbi:MAG TPA: WecB/TagA/CpsF family glycosyltransferase [Puia sp.]|jgi:N-acetylglucosaminyldiphosphoundecaprenol N-acetyl-beta-D-mannosaminyltransferase|nr:WecB/TagA/CpsF family glycosyltransferase [Puia sp.]